ncbi:glutamine synthetase family protein [Longivirga aurantiaca]|uniref:Glutamine synthetase family protein n=1 Tax=Longivirga aurantiaca TaxID=1837743 RepID=A0ABW1SWK2_9ACTN
MTSSPLITYVELLELARQGEVDTVVCGTPDPVGRIVGKRLTVPAFTTLCVEGEGIGASTFVFAVDVEMTPLDLPVSSAENGWADFRLVPDMATMRRMPWEPRSVFVLCDAYEMGSDDLVAVAPRTILRRQIERAEALGLRFKFASELEFFLSSTPQAEAWRRRYRDLEPLTPYRNDYQVLQGGRDEWFISQVRNHMSDWGIPIESSKPEWGLGQQEVTLDYTSTLEMADRHVLFKYGVKELAHRAGLTCTFMAKPAIDEVGSSCHLHVSMWDLDDNPVSWDGTGPAGMSARFGSFLSGQLAHVLDLGLLLAPTVNSYKRFQPDQFAGTAIAVGVDNRSCAFRLVGRGPSFRMENRIPGADVNPYYAYSATIAAGLAGIEAGAASPELHSGNAWTDGDLATMTTSLHRSVDRFAAAEVARDAFGDDVFEHLLQSARAEVLAFDSGCVTDWELVRYYERV